ncbi:hypothetical protein [Mariniluteicoccus flavus]
MAAPDGVIVVSDATWSDIADVLAPALVARRAELDEAKATLMRGEEWNFSGWLVSREGVRTPRVQARWGHVVPRISTDMTSTGFRERAYLHDPRGMQLDMMTIEDNDLFADLVAPYVRVLGR